MRDLNSSGEYRLFFMRYNSIIDCVNISPQLKHLIYDFFSLLLMSLPDSNHFSVVIKMNYEVHFNELKVMEMSLFFYKKTPLLPLSLPVLDVNDLCHKRIKWENAHRESKYTTLTMLHDLIEIFLGWKLFWISRNDFKKILLWQWTLISKERDLYKF